jgi:hypothetical protein
MSERYATEQVEKQSEPNGRVRTSMVASEPSASDECLLFRSLSTRGGYGALVLRPAAREGRLIQRRHKSSPDAPRFDHQKGQSCFASPEERR